MPVVVDIDLFEVLKRLEADDEVVQTIKNVKLKATFTPSGTKLVIGAHYSELLLPSMLVYKVHSGKATMQEKLSVKGALLPAIWNLMMAMEGYSAPVANAPLAKKFMVFVKANTQVGNTKYVYSGPIDEQVGDYGFGGVVTAHYGSKSPNTQEIPKQSVVEASPAMPNVMSPAQMDGPPVDLTYATKLYQPVRGTGNTSRYHVVALGDGLNVAARVKDGVMSVRVEGTKISALKNQLKKAGIWGGADGTVTDKHMACHFAIQEIEMMKKTLGAVIAALPVTVRTPMPNVKLLVGKGK